jgi:hypothetical protein
VDRVVADKAQTYCPRLEGLGPWFLRSRNCLDTYELLNNLFLSIQLRFKGIKVYLLFYSLAQQLTPKESSIRAYRNVCKVFLHSPCSNDRRRILARS